MTSSLVLFSHISRAVKKIGCVKLLRGSYMRGVPGTVSDLWGGRGGPWLRTNREEVVFLSTVSHQYAQGGTLLEPLLHSWTFISMSLNTHSNIQRRKKKRDSDRFFLFIIPLTNYICYENVFGWDRTPCGQLRASGVETENDQRHSVGWHLHKKCKIKHGMDGILNNIDTYHNRQLHCYVICWPGTHWEHTVRLQIQVDLISIRSIVLSAVFLQMF